MRIRACPALVKKSKVGGAVPTFILFFLKVVGTAPISSLMKLIGVGTGPACLEFIINGNQSLFSLKRIRVTGPRIRGPYKIDALRSSTAFKAACSRSLAACLSSFSCLFSLPLFNNETTPPITKVAEEAMGSLS